MMSQGKQVSWKEQRAAERRYFERRKRVAHKVGAISKAKLIQELIEERKS